MRGIPRNAACFAPVAPPVPLGGGDLIHERADDSPPLLDWVQADENQRKGEFVLMLAGDEAGPDASDMDIDGLLGILLDELPLKQAASLAARISGEKKNLLYQRALVLSGR